MRPARPFEALSLSGAPTSSERIAADSRLRLERDTGRSLLETVACPGGCGGLAVLEPLLEVRKNGALHRVRIAQCQGSCRQETRLRSGRVRSVPARFEVASEPMSLLEEVPAPEPPAEHPTEPAEEEQTPFAQLLANALAWRRIRQEDAAVEIGCSQSVISKLLHGQAVRGQMACRVRAWALGIQQQAASRVRPSVEPAKDFGASLTLNPYEAVLRRLLEQTAQERLQQLAGKAARGVVVRVTLEWDSRPDT